ncbi:unnamed protein product [Sphagnum balticum]
MEVLDICVGILFCRTNNDEELTDRVSGKFGKCNIHGSLPYSDRARGEYDLAATTADEIQRHRIDLHKLGY